MGLFDLLNGNSNKKLKAFLADPLNKELNLNTPGGRLNLTPLIYAIGVGASGSLETARLLLEHGASVQDTENSAIDSTIKFLYMKAYTNLDGYLAMVALLVKYGAKTNEDAILAIQQQLIAEGLPMGSESDLVQLRQEIMQAVQKAEGELKIEAELKMKAEQQKRLYTVETEMSKSALPQQVQTDPPKSPVRFTGQSPAQPLNIIPMTSKRTSLEGH